MTPETIFHAVAGTTAIVAGAVALSTRKGGRIHRTAGTVFFVTLMIAAASAVYLAWRINNVGFMIGGVLIIYLLATGWMTVRRRPGETGLFEIGSFLVVATGAIASFWSAIQAQLGGAAFMGGIPAFGFAVVAALAAGLDLSVILRRGLSGKQRIVRHLWRTHVGLFAAVGSFFPGQLQFFPEFIQRIRPTILLFIPAFMIVGLMIYWLLRVWLGRRTFAKAASEPAPV